uniref:Uncharacterized protein n=1 Tax=Pavo cristatus TaxID=9049 RepID=A0A8C9F469_PAVCR
MPGSALHTSLRKAEDRTAQRTAKPALPDATAATSAEKSLGSSITNSASETQNQREEKGLTQTAASPLPRAWKQKAAPHLQPCSHSRQSTNQSEEKEAHADPESWE